MSHTYHPTALRVLEVVERNLDRVTGVCALSNQAIAAEGGLKARTAKFWIGRLIHDKALHTAGKGKARKLSLVANPVTDRAMVAVRFAIYVFEKAGMGVFSCPQVVLAKAFGISVPVLRGGIEQAIENGWVERAVRVDGTGRDRREHHTYRLTEKGAGEVRARTAPPTPPADPVPDNVIAQLSEQVAQLSARLFQMEREAYGRVVQLESELESLREENERLRSAAMGHTSDYKELAEKEEYHRLEAESLRAQLEEERQVHEVTRAETNAIARTLKMVVPDPPPIDSEIGKGVCGVVRDLSPETRRSFIVNNKHIFPWLSESHS